MMPTMAYEYARLTFANVIQDGRQRTAVRLTCAHATFDLGTFTRIEGGALGDRGPILDEWIYAFNLASAHGWEVAFAPAAGSVTTVRRKIED